MIGTGNPELLRRVQDSIRRSGPITFARFMEIALYEPGLGYYHAGPDRIGKNGDFFTAGDVGPLFGRCMARQVAEMDGVLGGPDPLDIVEFGGGRGLLALDLLRSLEADHPRTAERSRYLLVDRSPGMLKEAAGLHPRLQTARPEHLPAGPGKIGCLLAVELFDALPVHRLVRRKDRIREIRVGMDPDGALQEVEAEPGPELIRYVERYGAVPVEGRRAEVCLEAGARFDRMDQVLERGFMILVDYGYSAEEKYGPARSRGTLLAYHRHETNRQYLARVGEQDLTAHVNWTALADHAADRDWRLLALTGQDRFLIANGILEPLEARNEEDWRDPDKVRLRLQAKQLIHPEGMGKSFQVMVLFKGEGPLPRLGGLVDPFREWPPGANVPGTGGERRES